MKKYGVIAAFVFTVCAFNAKADTFGQKVKAIPGDCISEVAKETTKAFWKTFVLDPYIINPLKKIWQPESAAEIMQKKTASIVVLAKQIEQLKRTGADKKFVNSLSVKLTKEIENASKTECPCNK